jgi:hypothetical protein
MSASIIDHAPGLYLNREKPVLKPDTVMADNLAPASVLDLAIDLDLAGIDQQLRCCATFCQAFELENLVQLDGLTPEQHCAQPVN